MIHTFTALFIGFGIGYLVTFLLKITVGKVFYILYQNFKHMG